MHKRRPKVDTNEISVYGTCESNCKEKYSKDGKRIEWEAAYETGCKEERDIYSIVKWQR